jgi:hypothetical protein
MDADLSVEMLVSPLQFGGLFFSNKGSSLCKE